MCFCSVGADGCFSAFCRCYIVDDVQIGGVGGFCDFYRIALAFGKDVEAVLIVVKAAYFAGIGTVELFGRPVGMCSVVVENRCIYNNVIYAGDVLGF